MIEFDPLAAPLGAFVRNFDPAATPTTAFVERLAQGLQSHAVLIFRSDDANTGTISPAQLVQLGRAFGELEILPEPDKRHADHPEIFNLSNVRPDGGLVEVDEPQAVFLQGTQRWHTDSSFREIPALCTMLYAVEVTERGGQTQFADMRKTLGLLPAKQRTEIEALQLVHSYEYSRANNPGHMEPMTDDERAKYPPVKHPWVRRNADGSQSLYMGAHASHIVGRDPVESRVWFAEIEAQLSVHDLVYQHQWQVNDLVVWDNRTTLHRLLGYDIANDRRVMRRITVAGSPGDWEDQ
ncbi:MAG: TauD/TfdA dioxygenase family protein [Acidimicrobiales bacterium]|jgi:alpha-ketoglutarate-dependent taurine dioxygenase